MLQACMLFVLSGGILQLNFKALVILMSKNTCTYFTFNAIQTKWKSFYPFGSYNTTDRPTEATDRQTRQTYNTPLFASGVKNATCSSPQIYTYYLDTDKCYKLIYRLLFTETFLYLFNQITYNIILIHNTTLLNSY